MKSWELLPGVHTIDIGQKEAQAVASEQFRVPRSQQNTLDILENYSYGLLQKINSW